MLGFSELPYPAPESALPCMSTSFLCCCSSIGWESRHCMWPLVAERLASVRPVRPPGRPQPGPAECQHPGMRKGAALGGRSTFAGGSCGVLRPRAVWNGADVSHREPRGLRLPESAAVGRRTAPRRALRSVGGCGGGDGGHRRFGSRAALAGGAAPVSGARGARGLAVPDGCGSHRHRLQLGAGHVLGNRPSPGHTAQPAQC